MHYIRFLKPPRLQPDRSRASLTAKITITTDLGEAFLAADVVLLVGLEDGNGEVIGGVGEKTYLWKGSMGMRALEVVVPCGVKLVGGGGVSMVVRPKEERYAVERFEDLLRKQDGGAGVVAVRSMVIDLMSRDISQSRHAERVFKIRTHDGIPSTLRIWEETGESIARHIWDAGLILSSYLTTIYHQPSSSSSLNPHIPTLPHLTSKLTNPHHPQNILELGSGCGIVSLTLHALLPSTHIKRITLTDLPEAMEILGHNIYLLQSHPHPEESKEKEKDKKKSKINHQVLDWSSPLPIGVRDTKWDLVFVADCTYNPDVVPDLVSTLGRVVDCSRDNENDTGSCGSECGGNESGGNGEKREILICIAMKVRHDSEAIFFHLMQEAGFVVREKCALGLGVLGGAGEEIEVFVFGWGEGV